MRLLSTFLAGLVVLGTATRAAAADDVSQFVGRVVTSMTVELSGGRPASQEVLSLVAVQKDQPLSLDAIRQSVQSLVTVGRFESVEVVASNSPGGVALVFNLVPRRSIEGVTFTGDTGLSADDLSRRLKAQYGVIPTSIQPAAVERTVKTLLVDEGYLRATTKATIGESTDPDRGVIVVEVHAGPRAVIDAVEITGASPLSKAAIIQQTGTAKGTPYRPQTIDDALVRMRDTLRSERYYQAEAIVEGDPTVSADGASVDLVLHVEAGPIVLGPLFTGDPPPAGSIDDLVPMKTEHSADDDLLDDAQLRIETRLRVDGYRDARATYTKTTSPQGLVISFAIARGPLYRVGKVDVTGNAGIARDVVNGFLAVSPGDPYSVNKVKAGVQQLQLEYAKRGYFEMRAVATNTLVGPPVGGVATVDVVIAVTEGPQAHVTDLVFQPAAPQVPLADLRAAMREKPGDPYIVAASTLDRATLETLYHDRGFPNARVVVTPTESADRRAITLTVTIDEGTRIFVQDIRVIGNHRVDSPAIIEAMPLKPGGPLGAAAVQKSRQVIQETFGFRTVSITEEPVLNDDKRMHVIVTVEEAPATTIAWGAGILVDQRLVADETGTTSSEHLDVGPRGSFDITRQNVGGRNRAVDFSSRVGLRTNPNTPDNSFGFLDYSVAASYLEHRAFQTRAELSFTAYSERDVQTDFNYLKQGVKAGLTYQASRHVSVSGQYQLQFTKVFDQSIPTDEQLLIDRQFPQVRLSTFSGSALWDRRNDPVAPSNGTLASADFEVAPRALGSEVGFVKTLLQVSGYRAIDNAHRFVAAARAEVGLAHGFATQEFTDPAGNPVINPSTGLPVFVAALPASERFYSGGGSSVRGFDQDVLGVPLIITNDGLSLGGNGLVVLNLELRTRVARVAGRELGIVTFVDGGNVFLNASDTSLTQLRGTVGLGVRYNSPLGPIRLDYGFKLTRLPFGTSGVLEPGWTWHLSVGEAF
jgi:outer membrane protein insertion porin family